MTDKTLPPENSKPSFSGFYKLTSEERLKKIQQYIPELTNEDIAILLNTGSLDLETINRMVENAVGAIAVPFGLAVNFIINDKVYSIPMAIEEPSVIAASCNSAKLTLSTGGFKASTTEQIMIGQIQILDLVNHQEAITNILNHKEQILEIANRSGKTMVALGGGAKDVRAKIIDTRVGKMVICELLIDCLDAMGANAVSSMAEIVSPYIEEITGGRVLLRILSNLSDLRLARASCVIPKEQLGGEDVVDNIIAAAAFAESDPYRAATHNKGVMNGISAVILATANDTRAIEAGAHAFAARNGHYGSLTKWDKNGNGDLVGFIEIPLAVGIIGGATKTNPIAQIALKIMRIESASELAQVAVVVGLAQNLGALRALATTGIIKGHMKLHSKNIAVAAGAEDDEIELIAQKMIDENNVKYSRAVEILAEIKKDVN
ncbi:MAG: hydroxymethylglutaryl-CoA reductase, degradative [Candidatus Heimdallarchaeota archaeon]|nr:hydroxymethylglutaryl-CoA reductase, degradative [Candidatus Heimdallarchaeota archaeon]